MLVPLKQHIYNNTLIILYRIMRYKKQLILLLMLLLPIGAHATGLSGDKTGNIDDIAKALATYFPKVTGTVTASDQDTIIIQSKDELGLSAGILLSVYRMGEPFYHPVMHVLLGHFEEEVGELEVVRVVHGEISAKAIGAIAPVTGNLVRLTAARIPIAVSGGVTEEDRFLIHELVSALKETGRFSMTKDPLAGVAPPAGVAPLYSITLTVSSGLIKVQMQNVKTGTIVSNMETTREPLNESDTIFESLQYQLFEKQQKGLSVK